MKRWLKKVVNLLLCQLIHWAYPQFTRQKGYTTYGHLFLRYFLMQKIVGFNRAVPWPVHFTSQIIEWQKIKKGICCDPGDSIGVYINASGGLSIGDNVEIAPHCVISTINHDSGDLSLLDSNGKLGVVIGDNVWIAANCTICAGVHIGNNVIIGAGCTIREDIPSDTIVYQDKALLVKRSKKDKFKSMTDLDYM